MYSKLHTYLILFGGVFALSTSAIFVTMANAPSSVTAFYRLLMAGVSLLPFFLFSRNCRTEAKMLQRKQWFQIISAGFFLALHYVLWFESLKYTSIASSTIIVCLQPLFSLGLEQFISKKKIKSTAIAGCLIALFGCFIIGIGDFKTGSNSLLGDILAFIAAGVISMYYFVGESVRKDVSAVTYSTLAYLVSSVILLIYIIIQSESLSGYTEKTWWAFAGLALISTIGGQFVFNLLLKNVPASAVTMSILGEPIGTCILAGVILHQRIAFQQFIGIVIIITGMFVFFFLPKGRKTNS